MLLRLTQTRPIIAFTGSSMQGAEKRVLSAGCTNYLANAQVRALRESHMECLPGWEFSLPGAVKSAVSLLVMDDNPANVELLSNAWAQPGLD